jgi:hypothetical protein
VNSAPAFSVPAARRRSPSRHAVHNAAAASHAGSSANSAFCHRTSVMNPASRPSSVHCTGVRRSRVAVQAQTNPATSAIEGAWDMDGSLTRYHSMNEPATIRPDAAAAIPDG